MSLRGLYEEKVLTITPNRKAIDAARMMLEHGVGDLVVIDDSDGKSRPVGMITDRDIALACVAKQADRIAQIRVSEVMTSDPVCAVEDQGVFDLIQMMRKAGVERLPVVNKDWNLVGLVSARHILNLLSTELRHIVGIAAKHREAAQTMPTLNDWPAAPV